MYKTASISFKRRNPNSIIHKHILNAFLCEQLSEYYKNHNTDPREAYLNEQIINGEYLNSHFESRFSIMSCNFE
jgi:hypothetical protein